MKLFVISGHMRKYFVVYLMIEFHDPSTRSAQIFILIGGVLALLAFRDQILISQFSSGWSAVFSLWVATQSPFKKIATSC